jgi:hypothetical protein
VNRRLDAPASAPRPSATEDAARPASYASPSSSLAARIADGRGLTAAGAASVMLAFGLVGGALDVLTGPGLRLVFALCFVLGCAAAALAVHREDLRAVIVMPPLVYALLAVLASAFEGWGGGSFLKGQALELLNALVLGAPVLVIGFATVLALALLRGVARHR